MDSLTGVALYEKAKKVIPGGTQLLSKRPEMFLPDKWPSYYSKCSGVDVWDIDGNRFIDMSISGVGTCILGYADHDVNEAVKRAVDSGSMCTLNCPEEAELAELLCELHPWADMARFARGGGEAMTVAVRIARAATGRDRVAFCGYHGWHDWYLSANLGNGKNLDAQLLTGLEPAGVPHSLEKTAIPFNYNKPEELKAIVDRFGDELAAIVMEPVRHSEPEEGFLEYVRETADRIGAVLIFDEVTAGWRLNIGGVHLRYGVNPDMAVFAKGMSNGFPMAAVVGIRDVMEAAQKTFISSTYWTERIGPAATLATIKKMQSHDVPSHLYYIGSYFRKVLKNKAEQWGLRISIHGMPPLSTFSFDYGEKSLTIHTLFAQEMLSRGFLVSKAYYATYSHQERHIDAYGEAIDDVFDVISRAIEGGRLEVLLRSPVIHSGFRRLA